MTNRVTLSSREIFMTLDSLIPFFSPAIGLAGFMVVIFQLRRGTKQRELDSLVKVYDINRQLITLGFSRPWNSVRNAFTAISGEPAPRRAYRVIAVKEPNGEIVSMTRRREADD